jgi:ribonuclease HII
MTELAKYLKPYRVEVGCDEAGRGCLAGPVCAAAVIIPKDVEIDGLNDSKKLSERKRDALRIQIEENCIWAVAFVEPKEIDSINILNASIKAMHLALNQIKEPFEHILIDGNRFKKYKETEHTCVIKGDSKFLSIAAASILAKTHRDERMLELAQLHPEYNWTKNKGYPTETHRKAIELHGSNSQHRMSFRLLPNQLKLFEN